MRMVRWRRLYLFASAATPVAWIVATAYVRLGPGWSGFARGMAVYPILVVALVASTLLSVVGGVVIARDAYRRRVDIRLVLGAVLASSVIVYASTHR